jgi:hypothetical protein
MIPVFERAKTVHALDAARPLWSAKCLDRTQYNVRLLRSTLCSWTADIVAKSTQSLAILSDMLSTQKL